MRLDPRIAALDLECVSYKVCRDEGWPLDRLDDVEQLYRGFWQVILDGGPACDAAPTREMDVYWHHHILDTQKYAEDCRRVFGTFLHHYPYSGVFGAEDAQRQGERVQNTLHRIHQLFMEDDNYAD